MKPRSRFLIVLLMVFFCGGFALQVTAGRLTERAAELKSQLAEKILPYWYAAQDTRYGGYLLADPGPAKEKSLVTQARMIWTFSLVHRKGYSTPQHDYLKAARHGHRFLMKHFYDHANGGYFWRTDLAGEPLKEHKFVYGQAFVIYALVEYHRASGDNSALQRAMELYGALQKHAHDKAHGGWLEHFTRDWKPLPLRDPSAEAEVAGLKSGNAHLHLMEAFTELYCVTGNGDVRRALEET
ncbi:MAG: AGE family epimerase/isomerase, partial [Verrucomicrobiae bacterium]|nr:AGE family epimerase/isomerase [Verrucomicrobiae bacterium]